MNARSSPACFVSEVNPVEDVRMVAVEDVLRARDERCARQSAMLEKHGLPVISFTMNIAGPVKCDGLIRRAFFAGVQRIEDALCARRSAVRQGERTIAFTGCEQLWSVDAPAGEIKNWMQAIEEMDELGRLFDIDVIDAGGHKLSREHERKCLICGADVRACARSRAHSVEELQKRTRQIIRHHFDREYALRIGMCAERALLCEAVTTPKPGLVDRENSGAHRDMDLFSFVDSAASLRGWFEDCARIGMETRSLSEQEVFIRLRMRGLRAERDMLAITGGVNTHKGALFSLGLICCGAGRLGEDAETADILDAAGSIAAASLDDLKQLSCDAARTGGEVQYINAGLTGVRGEAAAGFPSVRNIALPALKRAIDAGRSLNDAGLEALVALMARVPDSNILRRRGEAALQSVQVQAVLLERHGFEPEQLRRMNDRFVRENISPGGSADLLAAAYLLYFIEKQTGGNLA